MCGFKLEYFVLYQGVAMEKSVSERIFFGENEFFNLVRESRSWFCDCSFGASHVLFRVLAFWLKGIYVYFGGVRDYLSFLGAIFCS